MVSTSRTNLLKLAPTNPPRSPSINTLVIPPTIINRLRKPQYRLEPMTYFLEIRVAEIVRGGRVLKLAGFDTGQFGVRVRGVP